jgi:CO/xanthine dehydrogenase FAD-binding subunit
MLMLDLKALLRPSNPEEAVRLYSETDGNGLYVGGGTVIVPAGSPNLDFLIDVTSAGLGYLRRESDVLSIGAATTVADLASSGDARGIGSGLLTASALAVANHTVRNLATVGGNIASWAFPSDLPAALLALEASIVILDGNGRREVQLTDFYGDRRSVFRKGHLIVEVRVPLTSAGLTGSFEKVGRKKLDVAVINAAAALRLEGGVVRDARIALNGVGGAPGRATDAETYLGGRKPSPAAFGEAGRLATAGLSPKSDHRASGAYRGKVAAVAVRRALMRAAGCPDE